MRRRHIWISIGLFVFLAIGGSVIYLQASSPTTAQEFDKGKQMEGCTMGKDKKMTCTTPTVLSSTTKSTTNKIIIAPDEAACPVLGTVMKKSQMTPIRYKKKTYYICCADCKESFEANPEKYINHPAALTREMPD